MGQLLLALGTGFLGGRGGREERERQWGAQQQQVGLQQQQISNQQQQFEAQQALAQQAQDALEFQKKKEFGLESRRIDVTIDQADRSRKHEKTMQVRKLTSDALLTEKGLAASMARLGKEIDFRREDMLMKHTEHEARITEDQRRTGVMATDAATNRLRANTESRRERTESVVSICQTMITAYEAQKRGNLADARAGVLEFERQIAQANHNVLSDPDVMAARKNYYALQVEMGEATRDEAIARANKIDVEAEEITQFHPNAQATLNGQYQIASTRLTSAEDHLRGLKEKFGLALGATGLGVGAEAVLSAGLRELAQYKALGKTLTPTETYQLLGLPEGASAEDIAITTSLVGQIITAEAAVGQGKSHLNSIIAYQGKMSPQLAGMPTFPISPTEQAAIEFNSDPEAMRNMFFPSQQPKPRVGGGGVGGAGEPSAQPGGLGALGAGLKAQGENILGIRGPGDIGPAYLQQFSGHRQLGEMLGNYARGYKGEAEAERMQDAMKRIAELRAKPTLTYKEEKELWELSTKYGGTGGQRPKKPEYTFEEQLQRALTGTVNQKMRESGLGGQ